VFFTIKCCLISDQTRELLADATYMPSPLCFETTSDAGNLVKVRGVVLDNRGFPTGHPVAYNKVVSATVLAGVCPVTRTGRVLPPGEMKVQRRKSTVSEGAYEAVSRMSSMVPPSNASLAESPLPNGANAYDLPVSYHLDAPYDWTSCKATHRQNNFTELPDGLFSVTVPGEPVVLIFSRRSPSNTASGNSTSMRLGRGSTTDGNSGRPPSAGKAAGGKVNSSGLVWLVEVQYFFRLETGQVRILLFLRCLPLILTILLRMQAIFVPMPPHIYGELTRTMEGCEVLAKRKVVSDLLSRAHQLFNVCTMVPATGRANGVASEQDKRAEMAAAYKDLQAALWALGHIGSNELGCALILEADKKFVPWCIESVYSCPYYSLRGTFFYVLGLLSRTQQGSRREEVGHREGFLGCGGRREVRRGGAGDGGRAAPGKGGAVRGGLGLGRLGGRVEQLFSLDLVPARRDRDGGRRIAQAGAPKADTAFCGVAAGASHTGRERHALGRWPQPTVCVEHW
jgi:hypothetical protein